MMITPMLLMCSAGAADSPLELPRVTSDNAMALVYSADGQQAWWTQWNGHWGASDATERRIVTARNNNSGRWTEPSAVSFSAPGFSDDDPFLHDDWLYFTSDRPPPEGSIGGDADIWRYHLPTMELQHLAINSPQAEYSPVLTASGALYFASARSGGMGQGDIYRSEPTGQHFSAPRMLGPAINSATGEWNVMVTSDDQYLVFEASSRTTNLSVPGDLYLSWRSTAGWAPAVPLAELNTAGSDLHPRLHPNGRDLIYISSPINGHPRLLVANWPGIRDRVPGQAAPRLLVANRSSHEVIVLNVVTGEIEQRFATGAGPHLLSNVSSGRIAATGFGEFPRPHQQPVNQRPPFQRQLNSRLTLIDIERDAVVLDTAIADCRRPHASWIVADHAWVTCQDERAIAQVDLASGDTLRRILPEQSGAHVLSYEPQSGQLAVANTDSGSISLIDPIDGQVRNVKLAPGSEGLWSGDGNIWVANAMAGSVSVVDPIDAREHHRIAVDCGFPIAISGNTGPHVWLACFASRELIGINRQSFAVDVRHQLADAPLHVTVHPERGLAYVSLPRQNAVAEIDLESGLEVRRFGVGIEPDGLRWAQSPP